MFNLKCTLFDHDQDDGQIFFDIPFFPSSIPDESLRNGYVCKRHFHCRRCDTLLDTELADVTSENVADYYDWFENQYGIRPSTA
jgi:hypothetical protein